MPFDRMLRGRFARFLGEMSRRSIHRKWAHGSVPLWDISQDCELTPSKTGVRFQHHSALNAVQLATSEVFERLRARNWAAYLVGGTLRDLLLQSTRTESCLATPRDIDVIIIGASNHELTSCFSELIARRTRFGGLHLVKKIAQVCEVHFDVWALADTWAFKERGIKPKISHFASTPFLNLDSVAIELYPNAGRPRAIYEEGFYRGIASRLIDINFERNPYPDVCIIRALIMAAKLQFALSRRLAEFISSWMARQPDALAALRQAQVSHYGQVRCSTTELCSWLTFIHQQLTAGSERIELRVSDTRQLGLWSDYPPLQTASQSDHLCGTSDLLSPTAFWHRSQVDGTSEAH